MKRDSAKKHQKRKHPKEYVSVQRIPESDYEFQNDEEIHVVDEDLPEVVFHNSNIDNNINNDEDFIDLTSGPSRTRNESCKDVDGLFIDLTDGPENDNEITVQPVEENDFIIQEDMKIGNEVVSQVANIATYQIDAFNVIPDNIYWESVLGALEC